MPIYHNPKERYTVDRIFSESENLHLPEGAYYKGRPEVMSFFNEYFDMSDKFTRSALIAMNEADHSKVLTSLTVKLYDHIVKKTDKIDFGEIPKSKGDMKKLSNYENLVDCLQIIRDMLIEYKEDTIPVDQISLAVSNVVGRKDKFMVAFSNNAEFPIMLYNVIVLGIYSSLSYIIASCIEYIKKPRDDAFEISLDRVAYAKSKDYILFDCLAKFNAGCADGTIDKCIENTYKAKHLSHSVQNLHESTLKLGVGSILGAFAGTALSGAKSDIKKTFTDIAKDAFGGKSFTLKGLGKAITKNYGDFAKNHKVANVFVIIGLIFISIALIRKGIYYYYHLRMKFSDYCAIQASLVEMNASNIEYNNTIDENKKRGIISKQMAIAKTFKTLSNVFAIGSKKAEIEAEKDIESDESDSDLTMEIDDEEVDDSPSALF